MKLSAHHLATPGLLLQITMCFCLLSTRIEGVGVEENLSYIPVKTS